MVADDDRAIVHLIAATLEDDDRYDVLSAENAEQALEMARREVPDLLFLDIMMPRLDGYQVCQSLKNEEETAGIHVVMLTALAQDINREKARQAGANDYFTKPFSPIGLLQKVDEVLGDG